MIHDPKRAWLALRLFAVTDLSMPVPNGAGLDPQEWLREQLLLWPEEFAYDDWSTYRPAIRKIRLVQEGL
ncbi:MAG: hypothetical protein ABI234_11540 [Ktedonobacteraceae bacterium]